MTRESPAQAGALRRVTAAVEKTIALHWDKLAGGRLVIAVSGGPDSLALLIAAASIPIEQRPELVAAYFAHAIDQDADAKAKELVERVAADLGVALVHGGADVPALANDRRQSLETAARDTRYTYLAEAAESNGAYAIAVAHTLDDQAETVLLRLSRGSGLRGASGMRLWSTRTVAGRVLRLLRPLLGVPRTDTLAVCKEMGVKPHWDRSNQLVSFARNRIRHNILPELKNLNPDVNQALARFAELAWEAQTTINVAARVAVAGAEQRRPGLVTWPRETLLSLAPPLFAAVAQGAWEYLHGAGPMVSSKHVSAMWRLVCVGEGGVNVLPRASCFTVEQGTCTLRNMGAASAERPLPDVVVPLAIPGSSRIGAWVIESKLERSERVGPFSEDRFTAALDAATLTYPVALRRRRPGDHIVPLGMPGPMRLQDLLVNAHVPRTRRDSIPIVDTAGGIAWVAGVRLAAWARVTEHTERVLVLKARRADWSRPEGALPW